MRGALAAGSVVAVVSLAPTPATADPQPPQNSADALKQLQDLSGQAEQLTEQWHVAQDQLAAKQKDLAQANKDADQAKVLADQARAQKAKFQTEVDKLADASFQGARFNQLSALLVSNSPQDFLDRASALDMLASDNATAIGKLSAVVAQATDAEKQAADAKARAQQATEDAVKIEADMSQRKQAMDQQIKQVKAQFDKLSASAKKQFTGDSGDMGSFLAPPGAVGEAMQIALAQRGKPYVWGAAGPSSFDCSGLMLYAFKQVGISLPHSAASQQQMGMSVSRSELQPGDLVFFGSPAHHVGMYVGNGEMVNAADFGIPVRVQPLNHDYSGARRLGQ